MKPIVLAVGLDRPALVAEAMRIDLVIESLEASDGVIEISRSGTGSSHITIHASAIGRPRSATSSTPGIGKQNSVSLSGGSGVRHCHHCETELADASNAVAPGDGASALRLARRLRRLIGEALPDVGTAENAEPGTVRASVEADLRDVGHRMGLLVSRSVGELLPEAADPLADADIELRTGAPYGPPRLMHRHRGEQIDLLTPIAADLMQSMMPPCIGLRLDDEVLRFAPLSIRLPRRGEIDPLETLRVMAELGIGEGDPA